MNNSTTTTPPNGYKKTAIGIIPMDWEVNKLFEICNFTNGKGHEQIIDTSGKYILVNSKFVSTQGVIFKNIDTNLCPLKKNDIAIVMSDVPDGKAIAKCFYVDKDDLYSLNQRVGNIRVKSIADSKFIYYQLDRNKYYLKFDDGIKQTNLRKDEVLNCPILFPPLPEQQKITEILSTWDDAIAKCKETINSIQDRNKGLAQQLLTGKKRLNGFRDKWEVKSIRELFTQIKIVNDGEIGHSIMTISAKTGFVRQQDKFDRIIAGDSLKKYTQLKKYDFAYNKGNSKTYPMGCIYQLLNDESALVPFVYICFEPKSIIEPSFYKFWFSEKGLDNQLKKIITSGARGDGLLNVNSNDFFNLKIPFLEKKEQTAIAQVLETADQELKSYETKLEALQLQKKGLMQQLLTGKIRVNVK